MKSRETYLAFISKLQWIMNRKTSSVLSTLKSVIVQYHSGHRKHLCFLLSADKINCYGFHDILIIWPDALIQNGYLIINIRGGEGRVGGQGVNVEDSHVCEWNYFWSQFLTFT